MTPTTRPPETLPDRSPPRVLHCQIVQLAAVGPESSSVRYPVAAVLLIFTWVALDLAYLVFGCPLDLGPIQYIATQSQGSRPHRRGDLGSLGLVPPHDRHLGPRAVQRGGDGMADSPGGAGDKGGFAGEIDGHHVASP